jgi:5-methylcytosine-specific restriction endonuclease McrA
MLCTCGHPRSQHPEGARCDYAGYSCSCAGFERTGDPLAKPARRGPKPPKRIPRGSRPSRVRKRDSRGKLRELADDLFSLYIRTRDEWTCRRCGSLKWQVMQCAHLMPKGAYPALRYEERNAICLCYGCHKHMTHRWFEWQAFLAARILDGQAGVHALGMEAMVRVGSLDYAAACVVWSRRILELRDFRKIEDRYEKLLERGRALGLFQKGA